MLLKCFYAKSEHNIYVKSEVLKNHRSMRPYMQRRNIIGKIKKNTSIAFVNKTLIFMWNFNWFSVYLFWNCLPVGCRLSNLSTVLKYGYKVRCYAEGIDCVGSSHGYHMWHKPGLTGRWTAANLSNFLVSGHARLNRLYHSQRARHYHWKKLKLKNKSKIITYMTVSMSK